MRGEDVSHSLMGTFCGKMPTIYREGRGAFCCLQKDILKRIPGQGTFDWDPERIASGMAEGPTPSQGALSDFAFSKSITTHDASIRLDTTGEYAHLNPSSL